MRTPKQELRLARNAYSNARYRLQAAFDNLHFAEQRLKKAQDVAWRPK